MSINGIQILNEDLAEQFACMFEKKITDTASTTAIEDNVYNGSQKVYEQNKNFRSECNIRKAILSLKLKNSEGFDRIPQRMLLDGISLLIEPFMKLFNLIYLTNTIPEQWSIHAKL